MAHIASCLVNAEHTPLSRSLSPAPSVLSSYPWRMLPAEPAKYPSHSQHKPSASLNIYRTLDPKASMDAAVTEKQTAGSVSQYRPGRQASPRPIQISVPEAGSMTTDQEPLDSPTIPGCPPVREKVHERSISAPHNTGDGRREESQYLLQQQHARTQRSASHQTDTQTRTHLQVQPQQLSLPQAIRHQLSPSFAPSADPVAAHLQARKFNVKPTSDSTTRLPPRAGAPDMSPYGRMRYLPSSSTPDLLHPGSTAVADGTSFGIPPALLSAPITDHMPASSNTWDPRSFKSAQTDRRAPQATPYGHGIGNLHMHHNEHHQRHHPHPHPHQPQHRRGVSCEQSAIGMDRGRPRKPVDVRNNNAVPHGNEKSLHGDNKRAISLERRAFEELPKGWPPSDVNQKLSADDVSALQKQALEQAERFEVLKVEDVDSLSKELRQLDERTEYLRQTQESLRAGRRNLHHRICQYLRSARVAKFSQNSMLKQEEALAELDASIDDWVSKLEQAENRRTRVRQKLLEHIAAAAIIGTSNATAASISEPVQSPGGIQSPTGPRELSTPPRSPLQSSFYSRSGSTSPSPQRVVAQIPSTILEQPVLEDGANSSRTTSLATLSRGDIQSIRIYAGDDVFALLADVEDEMIKMGTAPQAESEHDRQQERQRSHEMLHGYSHGPSHFVSPWASHTAAQQMPASPETSPTTMNGSARVPRTAGGPVLNGADVQSLTPSPLAPAGIKAGKEAGPFLTSAVFNP
ncbi:hypothetical protein E4U22_006013 [Claviceps purpurea]|nr:hypothetical protein E4U22_006013 [Claviceps purpurea]